MVAEPTPLPVLSLALAHSSPTAFTDELHSALTTVGFFQLIDIKIVEPAWEQSWDAAFAASAAFFALPDSSKRELQMLESRHFRGYSGVAEEVTFGKKDLREQIDLGCAFVLPRAALRLPRIRQAGLAARGAVSTFAIPAHRIIPLRPQPISTSNPRVRSSDPSPPSGLRAHRENARRTHRGRAHAHSGAVHGIV